MISTARGFIFIHIPKTAGNSVQEALLPFSDDAKTTTRHQDGIDRFGIQGPITVKKHAKLSDYETRLGTEALARYVKVSVIRNPWERALSSYFSPHRWMERRGDVFVPRQPEWDEARFLELLADMEPQSSFLKTRDGTLRIDRLMRFENIAEDFRATCAALNLPVTLTLRHRNPAWSGFDRRHFYRTPHLVEAVARVMAEDIERWNYRPEPA
jgi:hypothetical protein